MFDKIETTQRVNQVARQLQLEGLLDRKPHELSGGQAQRVALGRTIVMEPDAFLLDEPLANLDAALRVEMRTQIKRIQKQLGVTTIFVTHDQEEALSLGDSITVMHQGQVQQVGSPHDIYHRPANLFVATFIGSPSLNQFEGTLQREGGQLYIGSALFRLPAAKPLVSDSDELPQSVTLGIRPEFVKVALEPSTGSVTARVALIEPLGSRTMIYLDADGVEIRSVVQGETDLADGDTVNVIFDMDRALFFDQDGVAWASAP